MQEEPVIGSAKVGSRGQIVLPVDIRKKCSIAEGDTLIVVARPGHGSWSIGLMKASHMASFLDQMEGATSKIRSLMPKEEE